jgi:hypothetical protein
VLTAQQEFELVSGRDTKLHSHDFDRAVTHDTLSTLQNLELPTKVSAAAYTLRPQDDYLLCDATAAPITITVPLGRGGRVFTVIRVAGGNNVTITATAPDTINGAATLVIGASFTPKKLKWFKTYSWLSV